MFKPSRFFVLTANSVRSTNPGRLSSAALRHAYHSLAQSILHGTSRVPSLFLVTVTILRMQKISFGICPPNDSQGW